MTTIARAVDDTIVDRPDDLLAPPDDAAPAPPPTWQTSLHEIMAALVALVLLTVATIMLWETFATGRTPKIDLDAYARQKDIMLYGLTLLGTVTGYYLGRVPAERRADQAQQSASTAQRQLGKAQDRANKESVAREIAERTTADVRRELPRVNDLVRAGLAAPRGATRALGVADARETTASDVNRDALQEAANTLDALMLRLS